MCVERSLAILPYLGSGLRPALRSATTIRWFGMITKKTLAVMIVAVMAPRCKSAARPVKMWFSDQETTTMPANSTSITAVGYSLSGERQSAS